MPKEAVLMVANRNVRIASTSSHIIIFEKGKHTLVPASMVSDCLEKGVLPVEDTADVTPDEPAPIPKAPIGDEREEAIRNTIHVMRKRNERGDFTGAGRPDLRVLSSMLGFRADRHEVEKIWKDMQQEEGEAKSLEE